MEVDGAIASQIRSMTKGKVLHARRDAHNGFPSHHGPLAALAAAKRGAVSPRILQSDLRTYAAANTAKHTNVSPPASGVSLGCRWADLLEEDAEPDLRPPARGDGPEEPRAPRDHPGPQADDWEDRCPPVRGVTSTDEPTVAPISGATGVDANVPISTANLAADQQDNVNYQACVVNGTYLAWSALVPALVQLSTEMASLRSALTATWSPYAWTPWSPDWYQTPDAGCSEVTLHELAPSPSESVFAELAPESINTDVNDMTARVEKLERSLLDLARTTGSIVNDVVTKMGHIIDDSNKLLSEHFPVMVAKGVSPVEMRIDDLVQATEDIRSRLASLEQLPTQTVATPTPAKDDVGSRLQLRATPDRLPHVGEQVYIDGVRSEIYNRRFGRCEGLEPSSGRVVVSLWHDLPGIKLMPHNLIINANCPRCSACLEGRTICCECEYGAVDGGLLPLPRPSENRAERPTTHY